MAAQGRWVVSVIAGVALAVALLAGPASAAAARPAPGVATLVKTLKRIEGKPRYRQSDWGYSVIDERTGRVIAAQNSNKMFDPGSTMKIYSVSTALAMYGANYRFRTPVYRQGTVAGGVLTGNLVLVGSGDLTFGLRQTPNGKTLAYESLPAIDHSYADQLPGAVEPFGNPFLALDELARSIRASGITQVAGDVVIDDRLFTPYDGFPDGLMTSIWVNENLVDLLVTPGAVGQPATVAPRPITGSYTVDNQVTTAARGKGTTINVSEPTPNTIRLTGHIAAGSAPALRVWEVSDPAAFARTAFIEALGRAGVTVTAPVTGPNPHALLPPRNSYQPADRVAQHVSLPLSQYTKLILKVSYNRGADLMACLAAVKLGSSDCADGMTAEVRPATRLGVRRNTVIPMDGAGSDDQGRTTPGALAAILRGAAKAPFGSTLRTSLPILGRDGTLANVFPKSDAAGHAQVKTGNRVVGNAAGQIIVLGNSLAGYVQTKSGRRVIAVVTVGNVPLATELGFFDVVNDQARMLLAVYRNL